MEESEPVSVEYDRHASTGRGDIRRSGGFVISGLTSGHGVFHWFSQSFLVMLPQVQATFGLSEIGIGAIVTTREVVSGIVNLPGGVVVDMLRRYWGLVLAICMGGFGVGWLVMGISPVYPLLLLGMALIGVFSSTWHLPAMASLSHHFSHRRGTALSVHAIGGNIGDVIGPVLTGILLGVMSWRGILSIYAVIPMFLAFLVFWAFRDIGKFREEEEVERTDFRAQMAQTRTLLRNSTLWGITIVSGLRGMASLAFVTFLPLYLANDLGMSPRNTGFHIGLLVLVGIVATPLLGYLSDRINRKLVLVPGMLALCLFTLLLIPFGEGVTLIILLALLGLFLYSDQPILTAAALDVVGQGVATTTLGVLSFSRFVLSAASPLIAGGLYQAKGIEGAYIYIAGTLGVAAVTLIFLPISRSAEHTVEEGHRH